MLRRSKPRSTAHFFNRLLLNWLESDFFHSVILKDEHRSSFFRLVLSLLWKGYRTPAESIFFYLYTKLTAEFCLLSSEFADQIRTDESSHCSVVKFIFFGKFLLRHWSSPSVSDMVQNQIARPFNHCTFFNVGFRLILTLICLPSFKTWRSLRTLS